MTGASRLEVPLDDRLPEVVTDRLMSKKLVAAFGSGASGNDSIDEVSGDVAGLSMKLREMWEKSDSAPELMLEFEDATEREPISGALRACTFVVEINSVGREMRLRLMVPAAYLTLPSRMGIAGASRFPRFVKALARDIADEVVDMLELFLVVEAVESCRENLRVSVVQSSSN